MAADSQILARTCLSKRFMKKDKQYKAIIYWIYLQASTYILTEADVFDNIWQMWRTNETM